MAALGEPVRLERDICRAIELLEKLQRSGEVPPQKLQALQRVLQNEFCTAVREVYEHVYETVDISSSPEVRANATARPLLLHLLPVKDIHMLELLNYQKQKKALGSILWEAKNTTLQSIYLE